MNLRYILVSFWSLYPIPVPKIRKWMRHRGEIFMSAITRPRKDVLWYLTWRCWRLLLNREIEKYSTDSSQSWNKKLLCWRVSLAIYLTERHTMASTLCLLLYSLLSSPSVFTVVNQSETFVASERHYVTFIPLHRMARLSMVLLDVTLCSIVDSIVWLLTFISYFKK
jgi:hypothetical protein